MAVKNSKQLTMSMRARGIETRILDCGGRRLASVDGPNGSALDFYALNKTVVIVQDFANDNGIEVYFSRSESQLKDLERAIEELSTKGTSQP